MTQTKSATDAIETRSTAMRALVVGAFAHVAGGWRNLCARGGFEGALSPGFIGGRVLRPSLAFASFV